MSIDMITKYSPITEYITTGTNTKTKKSSCMCLPLRTLQIFHSCIYHNTIPLVANIHIKVVFLRMNIKLLTVIFSPATSMRTCALDHAWHPCAE
jgi:hypothetical protein